MTRLEAILEQMQQPETTLAVSRVSCQGKSGTGKGLRDFFARGI